MLLELLQELRPGQGPLVAGHLRPEGPHERGGGADLGDAEEPLDVAAWADAVSRLARPPLLPTGALLGLYVRGLGLPSGLRAALPVRIHEAIHDPDPPPEAFDFLLARR